MTMIHTFGSPVDHTCKINRHPSFYGYLCHATEESLK